MSKRYKTSLCLELEVKIECDIDPSERATRIDPGCPAQVHIDAVMHNGVDISSALTPAHMKQLAEEILDEFIENEREDRQSAMDYCVDQAIDEAKEAV